MIEFDEATKERKLRQARKLDAALIQLLNQFLNEEKEKVEATTVGPILLNKAAQCAVEAGLRPVDFLRLALAEFVVVAEHSGKESVEIPADLGEALKIKEDPSWSEMKVQ